MEDRNEFTDAEMDEQIEKMSMMAAHITGLFYDHDTHPTTALRTLAVCAASIIAAQSGTKKNIKHNREFFHAVFDDYMTPASEGGKLVYVTEADTPH